MWVDVGDVVMVMWVVIEGKLRNGVGGCGESELLY